LVAGTIIYWLVTKNYQQVFPIGAIASVALAWMIARYFQYLLPKYSVATDSTTEDVAVHDIDHFRKVYFDKILGKTDAQCVCIVVDNLDRVEVEDALAIMRTLKTFIVDAKEDEGTNEEVKQESLNKVVFILPCCDKELKEHIEKSGAVKNGAEFLQKLFNVSFRIPEFRLQDAFQYTRILVDKMGLDFDERHKSTICHIVSQTYCKNPRKAKIFLNNFLMLYNVAKACEEAGKIEHGIITNHPDWLAISIAHKEQEQAGGIELYISSLRQEVGQEFWTALTYLKRPSDFEKIEGFSELLQMAQQYDSGFSRHLAERAKDSQDLIDAIWRNTDSSDFISQGNVIASVISAIEINQEVQISSVLKNSMAGFIGSQYAQDMQAMSGKLVYERILKGNTEAVMHVMQKLGQTVNGVKLSNDRIKFSMDLLYTILEDISELLQRGPVGYSSAIEKSIPNVIEKFLTFGDDIIPIALRYPQYKSEKIFTKSINMCAKGDRQIIPDDLVAYCMSLDKASNDGSHNHIKKTIEAFNSTLISYCNKHRWTEAGSSKHCMSLLKSLRTISIQAYEYNILSTESGVALSTINDLFTYADDYNKLEIIEVFKDYEGFDKWPEIKNIAVRQLNTRGGELLTGGSENIVCLFIKRNHDLVNQRLSQFVNGAANRYRSVCHLILNEYPERRDSVIPEVWNRNSEWVSGWIEGTSSKIDRGQKQKLQRILFGIANSKGHPVGVYQAISYVKIGNDKDAIDARTKHFDNLIKSKELSKIDGLESVLECINKAAYVTNDEQNTLLNTSWRGIDQDTAGENLKRLVKKVIRP
jgi:hypothetical protein